MAIEKNYVKAASVSRFDSEFSVGIRNRESMSSDDNELPGRNSVDSQDDDDDDDDGYDDADSGAGSDDFDLLEFGETHSEFCQVGDQTCCIPFELYDLPDLQGILSLDAWNECLTDDERFSLAKYLPDLDQETFMRTLKELFEGSNFHFGSPRTKLFQMLKGGLCEPRVCLYLQGMRFFQGHKHYHLLRKHQDFMVASFLQMREAWQNCKGYSIEEKLRVLNIMKSQKSLMSVRNGDVRSDSSGMEETYEALIMTKLGAHAHFQNYRAPSTSVFHQNEKIAKKDVKGNTPTVKDMLPVSSTMSNFGRRVPMPGTDTYSSEHRQKSKMRHSSIIQNISSGVSEDGQYGNTYTKNKRKSTRIPGSNVHLQAELAENYSISMNKPSPVHRRQKGNANLSFPLHQSKYLPDFMIEGNGGLFATGLVERGAGNLDSTVSAFASTLERQIGNEAYMVIDGQEGSDCKQYHQEPFESIQLRKRIKRRAEAESGSLDAGAEEVPVTELAEADVELEAKPQKKPFVLITPTIHTDFSFSVIHLLSAVRMALITPNKGKDSSEAGKQCGTSDVREEEENGNGMQCGTSDVKEEDGNGNGKQCGTSDVKEENGNGNHESMNGSIKEPDVKDGPHDKITTPSLMPPDKTTAPSLTPPEKTTSFLMPPDKTTTPSLPSPDKTTTPTLTPTDKTTISSLTVQEIVNYVRSNPGDPSILETQEPLLDLVRGVMKIFSSRIAPLGAKGWKPLVCYEKASKSWTWTGPVPLSSTDFETSEEVLSPEAWGIPHEMLVNLVDSFANWLKSCQETLRQIVSLAAPPVELMQLTFDEKERFKDLKAQKSLSTISTSSDEVRAYFQKEEQLRYSIPDRAFSYTAADGKKSIVAPLRRCGGKLTSKARDHVTLKQDRPPHVTILCLVRDAAARLPGGIGTRSDVCTLIRDSQFIVDDVPDAKVIKVVSGALDRLHYERDPCVQYVSERKLWVYLHRDREEEDFEDDGTSSTKKWKRPKKDAYEPDDQVTVACHGNVEPSGNASDIHIEPSCAQNDKIVEVGCDDMRQRTEDDDKASDIHDGAFQQMIENELQCQENSANESFDYNT